MRIEQHKMSLPPLPTTTLAIIINWVQRMGQILRHGEKVLQTVCSGGGKNRHKWGMVKKKMPGALTLPLRQLLYHYGTKWEPNVTTKHHHQRAIGALH